MFGDTGQDIINLITGATSNFLTTTQQSLVIKEIQRLAQTKQKLLELSVSQYSVQANQLIQQHNGLEQQFNALVTSTSPNYVQIAALIPSIELHINTVNTLYDKAKGEGLQTGVVSGVQGILQEGTNFLSTIPTWGWILGGFILIMFLKKR